MCHKRESSQLQISLWPENCNINLNSIEFQVRFGYKKSINFLLHTYTHTLSHTTTHTHAYIEENWPHRKISGRRTAKPTRKLIHMFGQKHQIHIYYLFPLTPSTPSCLSLSLSLSQTGIEEQWNRLLLFVYSLPEGFSISFDTILTTPIGANGKILWLFSFSNASFPLGTNTFT